MQVGLDEHYSSNSNPVSCMDPSQAFLYIGGAVAFTV